VASVTYLLLFVVLGYFAYMKLVVQPKQVAAANETYANMVATDVATRLGLEVVEGDPNINLMMLHYGHVTAEATEVKDGTGWTATTTDVKKVGVTLRGTPNGRSQEFTYWLESEHVRLTKQWTRTLHFALRTQVNASFPQFEVALRSPNALLKPKLHFALGAAPTGIPTVDAALVVYASDPKIAQILAPHLIPFIGHTYVHIVGDGQRLMLLADQATSSYATYFLEANAKLHNDLAADLERVALAA